MTPRILLVEDTPDIALWLGTALRQGGMQVEFATDGHAADLCLQPGHGFDAVLLDLQLPGQDGLSVLQALRGRGDAVPVLVLTARNRTDERIAGLDAGADDYLGKPFELAEVEARLRALVRRSQGADDRVQIGQLLLDRQARQVQVAGEALALPAREYEVLHELLSPPGRTVSKKDLSDKLSDLQDSLNDNALEAFISRLRKKLQGSGASIRTLRGLGYRIEEAAGE